MFAQSKTNNMKRGLLAKKKSPVPSSLGKGHHVRDEAERNKRKRFGYIRTIKAIMPLLAAVAAIWFCLTQFYGASKGAAKSLNSVREGDAIGRFANESLLEGFEASVESLSGRSKSICIVVRNVANVDADQGSISLSHELLSISLAKAGHRVTLFLSDIVVVTNNWHEVTALRKRLMKANVLVEYADPVHMHDYKPASDAAARSYEMLLWLLEKKCTFDVIHFADRGGVGFFAILAKRQGLHFLNTSMVVHAHGPTSWSLLENQQWPAGRNVIETDFLERESIRLADALVSASRYMVKQFRIYRWRVPDAVYLLPNVGPDLNVITAQLGKGERTFVEEIVFVGKRKASRGIQLFLRAILKLVRSTKKRQHLRRVTLFTPEAKEESVIIRRLMDDILAASGGALVINELEEYTIAKGCAYVLEKHGRLAVLPFLTANVPEEAASLIRAGAPLLISNVGGIPELVAGSDARSESFFEPNKHALYRALLRVLKHGALPVRPQPALNDAKRLWDAWHRNLHVRAPITSSPTEPLPFVSVVMTTYNRQPGILAEAVKSLVSQTYPSDRFEVVLVDDGSDRQESLHEIKTLEPIFHERKWRIMHQGNQYLGAARNNGVRAARGEFILFMDDDNLAREYEVETFVRAHSVGEFKDILVCLLDDFTSTNKPSTSDFGHRWLPLANKAAAYLDNTMGDANMMVRKSSFLELGGFTTDRVGGEDWEFLTKAAFSGRVVQLLPEALFWKRATKDSMLTSSNPFQVEFRAFRGIVDALGWDVAIGFSSAKTAAKSGDGFAWSSTYNKNQGWRSEKSQQAS